MAITVRFFASLREKLNCAEVQLEPTPALTVAEVWEKSTQQQPMPANILAAVNQEYGSIHQSVKDGDEVAFFPPVTGG